MNQLALLLILTVLTSPLSAKPFATLSDNELVIGNSLIQRRYKIENHQLIHAGLGSPYKQFVSSNSLSHPFVLGNPIQISITQTERPATNQHAAHLSVEFLQFYNGYQAKIQFQVFQNIAAIRQTNWIRIDEDISDASLEKLESSQGNLDYIGIPALHWSGKVASFRDSTDHHNNLVRIEPFLAYKGTESYSGNLLWLNPTEDDQGLFILKESPAGNSQLLFPGFDFQINRNGISVANSGLNFSNLKRGKWHSGYSSVIGIYQGGEFGMQMALRSYQKARRPYLPHRDAMIMMNTWGDRNRDARINEPFLKTEIDAAAKLGLTHFQIDDGWQNGLSQNSAKKSGIKWSEWETTDWEPHHERLPNGLAPIVDYAKTKGIELGLWFNPSRNDEYRLWERDANIVLKLYHDFGIRYFKIDGVELPTKTADVRFRNFCERLIRESNGEIVLNLDATAGQRAGYHYANEFGVVFLENRYTDWGNYYPHWTLRNLWQLSQFVPPERIQIEFLNLARNPDQYPENDPLAPANIPFDYAFATTMMGQPLAWFEASGLPTDAFEAAPLIKEYSKIMPDIHKGSILPVGYEPNGYTWTGFQSILSPNEGYLIIYRENTPNPIGKIETHLPSQTSIQLQPLLPHGKTFETQTGESGSLNLSLPTPFSFQLFRYQILNTSNSGIQP